MDFTIRIHQGEQTSLSDLRNITISNIALITKRHKYDMPHIIRSNRDKFGYSAKVKGKFYKGGGSHSYPRICFKGDYIDIEVKDFPRYPAYGQDKYEARNIMNGYNSILNDGFPMWQNYRKVEIINIKN